MTTDISYFYVPILDFFEKKWPFIFHVFEKNWLFLKKNDFSWKYLTFLKILDHTFSTYLENIWLFLKIFDFSWEKLTKKSWLLEKKWLVVKKIQDFFFLPASNSFYIWKRKKKNWNLRAKILKVNFFQEKKLKKLENE